MPQQASGIADEQELALAEVEVGDVVFPNLLAYVKTERVGADTCHQAP